MSNDKNDKKDIKKEEEKRENKEVTELKKRNEELENQVKRILADYQNLEKRMVNEKKDWIVAASRDLILKLLPVLDILMMAEKHVKDEGLKLSIKQFLDVLKTEGVMKIETQDKEFNPQLMECVDIKEGKEGKVLEEVRTGCMLNDKVLRPAQVVVGKSKVDQKDEGLSCEAGSISDTQKGDLV